MGVELVGIELPHKLPAKPLPLVLTPFLGVALTCVSTMDAATNLGMTSSATANLLATREKPATNVSQMGW